MPYLVEALGVATDAREAADALEDVFVRLASELHEVRKGDCGEEGAPFDALRKRLSRRTVGISDWTHPGGKFRVNGGQWDRGEIESNLRQIEIITLSLRTRVLASAVNVMVNPTQQAGLDAEGVVDTQRWALEAYGGVNVSNNGKLVEDARTLRALGDGVRKFFACRPSAWPWRSSTRAIEGGTLIEVNEPGVDDVRVFEFTPAPMTPSASSCRR